MGGMIAATALGVFFVQLLYVLVRKISTWKSKPQQASPAPQGM